MIICDKCKAELSHGKKELGMHFCQLCEKEAYKVLIEWIGKYKNE